MKYLPLLGALLLSASPAVADDFVYLKCSGTVQWGKFIPSGDKAEETEKITLHFKIDTKKAGEQLAALLIKRVNGEAVELLRETDPAILYPGESDGPPTVSSKELSCLLEEAKIVKT